MRRFATCAALLLCVAIAVTQESAVKSGPQPASALPGPFDAFVINGKVAAGRQHCLICENGLNPAVLVFAREPAAGKDAALNELLKKLDETLAKHQATQLGGFAVFLSPDARSSISEPASEEVDKLLEEAAKRNELFARLEKRAKALKELVVAAYLAEGPKSYNISAEAEVTVLFYQKLKVIANWAFVPEKMTESDVDGIVMKIDATLGSKKSKT